MTAETADILQFASKPTASFVTVTPEVATRWLERNTRNRKIRQSDLNKYKRDMLAGRWHLDGSPIRFSPEGILLDGQHRLLAIEETGVTVPLLVVRGIDESAQSVMDTGRKRSAADDLAIKGHKNPVIEAAVARIFIEVKIGRLDSGGTYDISHDEIAAVLEANEDIESAVEFTAPLARRTDCPPAMVAYTYTIMRRIDQQAAAEFWVAMAEGVGLAKGDPILALKYRFAEARRGRERLSRRIYLILIYRAWNSRRRGERVTFFRINSPSKKGGLVAIPTPK